MTHPYTTPLRRIPTPGGEVMHALKAVEGSFTGFGEAYFSTVDQDSVKGWKRHRCMTLNLVVPVGSIEFVVHAVDDSGIRRSDRFLIGPAKGGRYERLTVPPGLWMAFCGRAEGLNLLLNVASIGHEPDEADRADLSAFPFTAD